MQQKRFISIRLIPSEWKEIQQQYKSSGCRSLTQFVKKSLLNKLGSAKMFDLMQLLSFIIKKLGEIEETLDEKINEQWQQDMADIKSKTRLFYEKWSE